MSENGELRLKEKRRKIAWRGKLVERKSEKVKKMEDELSIQREELVFFSRKEMTSWALDIEWEGWKPQLKQGSRGR